MGQPRGGGGCPPQDAEEFSHICTLSEEKCKMHYFSLFYTKLYKPRVTFSRVWTKNTNCWEIFEKFLKFFDENSIEKLTFTLFLENMLIGHLETTSFFYNFPHFGRGGRFRLSPWLCHCQVKDLLVH